MRVLGAGGSMAWWAVVGSAMLGFPLSELRCGEWVAIT